jgi:ABC-type branched-subunit amino acid transport system permease subunit
MVGEHYPSDWSDKQVSIDFIGGTGSLTGEVIGSTAAGCIVKLVSDREPGEARARRIFYPWTAIRSIELLEDESEGRRPTDVPPPFEPPEYLATY